MLGKFFVSEFGKGLVAGAAKGFEKGFADDIERTKDNADRLVLTAYEGGVEAKKEFDRVYKDNRKIVDQIIANLGGAEGADNDNAIYAAQGLISDQGLNGALEYSTKLQQHYQDYNYDPIKMLQMGKRTNHSTPMTADLLTKSTVPPIPTPNIKELAKSADVGIMKFFGEKDYTAGTIDTRAKALLKARGVDINQTDLNLPPAVSVKIDPLIAGMKSNPIDEKIRLQVMYENADKTDVDRMALLKNMMNVQNSIINRIRQEKETRLPGPLNETEAKYYGNLAVKAMLDKFNIRAESNFKGEYIMNKVKAKKRELIKKYEGVILDKIKDGAVKGLLGKQGNFYTEVINSIVNNKNLVVVDGLFATGDGKLFESGDLDVLNEGIEALPKIGKVKLDSESTANLSSAELITRIKNAQKGSAYSSSMKEFLEKSNDGFDALVDLANKIRKEDTTKNIGQGRAMRLARERLGAL